MNASNTNGEKNLLIYDKSTKVGCIYFIGISSNLYRGKVILKKNSISDRIVRYTNLSENLLLIKNGNYNFKQTAILIKGITIFLHRQLEVLLTDFYAMYKKCLFSSINEYRLQNGILKKCRANRRHRTKKNVLSLQDGETTYGNDYSGGHDDGTFRRKKAKYLNKNRNIADINDLMLKENNELYENDYHFENEDIPNDENVIYQDMLTNTSSFDCSKFNNMYTINNGMGNINTKESSGDGNVQSNLNNTAFMKYNMLDIRRHTSAERNNYSNDSLLMSKTLNKKNFSFSILNSSLLFSGNIPHGKVSNNLGNGHLGGGNNFRKDNSKGRENHAREEEKKNKRIFAQIDKDTILRDNIWEQNKMNKRQKSDNQFSTHLKRGSYVFFLLYNDVKNGPSDNSISSSFHSYEQAKNFINFDTRKHVYNLFGNEVIQNEKINMQPNNFKLLHTKSTVSSINERKNEQKKNHLNFDQLRVNFNDEYFLKSELPQNQGGKRYSSGSFRNSYDQMDYNLDEMDYNFDRMSGFPRKNYEHRKSEAKGEHKNKNGTKDCKDVYNFSDTLKDSLSVPSSKLVSRRSFTCSEYKYNEELIKLKNYLHKISTKCSNVIEFDRIFPVKKISDKNISIIFYNLLVLASNAEVDVTQNYPDSNILIQLC
ncbi:conserved Plasmodium protein, unknown function [Plasmodium knowlesi strain H]|uniref:Uncharacterized protein n=3 Tax=Plasmodium knowlesi TaxID=5850 RepID=A0A5K1UC11_PLAKH|nr:conserved Plasmodium protein, unknown function [Plasmodium knowlesi strain H]OTN63676.1 Uncharacterized protein PKNOH_S140239400 [Plasmodium knowlesi]CAA9990816.1 conserved Plasmodium protein, unknown function [Plasmodium knowlesi strain H]SBO21010.1 conserved Plasmodium protein, unknown function [Plasmodium knowlesi strain H]SBO21506.1 conserved Plasmodium protein, unknown function [Plasmodium knowlesi strain H]VVS80290.1 conserved Plasmodium protein, unknown function [Plasmodium knowlesi |eukprot:XP_002262104.1 hypothetical protein, conserved in Plasmodium species [Plasmodium knowlesi strain H]